MMIDDSNREGGCGHHDPALQGSGTGHACSGVCAERPVDLQEHGPTPYEQIGRDAGVRALVDRFYDLMEMDPRFAALRAMHPTTLDGSRDKLYWFLSGWMGGPDLFAGQVGAPMLRARHLPYGIGLAERDQWLTCMAIAMADVGIEEPFYDRLLESFCGTADWMRNRRG
jgi:hemoglobin